MNRTTAPWRRLWKGVLIVALVSCSGSGAGRSNDGQVARSDASTTTADIPKTSTTVANPESAVIDAYLAYWRTANAYGAEQAPFDPGDFKNRFSPVTTGAQYDSLFERFQLNRAEGLVYRGGENDQFRPKVTELSGDRAVVEDCADDTGGIFDTRKNAFAEPTTPGQHSLITAVLRLESGTWKVSTQSGGDRRCTP